MPKINTWIVLGAVVCCLVLTFGQYFFAARETVSWGLHFSADNQPPSAPADRAHLQKLDTAYMGDPESKVIWLTFDAGYENGSTEAILDALQKHNAPAVFFLCGNYLERNPDLVRRMAAEEAALLDAEISINIDGTDLMYAGTSVKSEDLFTDIIYQINNGIIEPMGVIPSYQGAASCFPNAETNSDVEFLPATTYITWIVPVEEDKTEYTSNDIIFKEFTTKSITSGGSTALTLGTAETDRTSIRFPMSSEGAMMMYYAFMSKSDGDRIASQDNDTKAELILNNKSCVAVKGSEAIAVGEKFKPNSTMWIYAVGVDKDGKYGTVSSASATTAKMEYNNLTVTATAIDLGSSTATFKAEVTGGAADSFIYWFGKVSDPFWSNSSYLGATRQNAQQYMACSRPSGRP